MSEESDLPSEQLFFIDTVGEAVQPVPSKPDGTKKQESTSQDFIPLRGNNRRTRKGRRGGAKARNHKKKIQVGMDIVLSSNEEFSSEETDTGFSAVMLDYLENVEGDIGINNVDLLDVVTFDEPEHALPFESDLSDSSSSEDYHGINFDYQTENRTSWDEVEELTQSAVSDEMFEAVLNGKFAYPAPDEPDGGFKARLKRVKMRQESTQPPRNPKPEPKQKRERHKNVDFRGINRRIINFINDPGLMSCPLPAVPKRAASFISLLVSSYNINSRAVNSGNKKSHIITKTGKTMIPKKRGHIEKLISRAESQLNVTTSKESKKKPGSKPATPKKPVKSKPEPVLAPTHGTVVGATAKPLSESNIGHQLLSKMGWLPGQSIGVSGDGIVNPIEAVVRSKRRGLGA